MASLVSSSVATAYTGILADHFDTFKREIVINKEPIKTVVDSDTPSYPGYGRRREEVSFTLTPVSGVYNAIVVYNTQTLGNDPLVKYQFPEGTAYIKVESDAKDFITIRKTENIVIDGKVWNIDNTPRIQHFLGAKYYLFEIKETN